MKIDYLQSLWDRIAATPETIPVPDWHREILDERLKDLEADPHAGDSWEVVQERAHPRPRPQCQKSGRYDRAPDDVDRTTRRDLGTRTTMTLSVLWTQLP